MISHKTLVLLLLGSYHCSFFLLVVYHILVLKTLRDITRLMGDDTKAPHHFKRGFSSGFLSLFP